MNELERKAKVERAMAKTREILDAAPRAPAGSDGRAVPCEECLTRRGVFSLIAPGGTCLAPVPGLVDIKITSGWCLGASDPVSDMRTALAPEPISAVQICGHRPANVLTRREVSEILRTRSS